MHFEDFASAACADLRAKAEELLRSAISNYLGRTDWTVEEIRGRCTKTNDGEFERFLVDDVEVLKLCPLEYVEDGSAISVTRQARLIAPLIGTS